MPKPAAKIVVDTHAAAPELSTRLRLIIARIMRGFRDQIGPDELSMSFISVLRLLDVEGPNTVTGLARLEGMRPQSMSAIVAELGAKGFVVGARDPNDGRSTIHSLTPAGLEALKRGRALRQDWLAHRIDTNLTLSEREQLAKAIELLERLP